MKKGSLDNLSKNELNSLSWCNKCAKFYARVKTACGKLHLNMLGGLFQKRILLQCQNSGSHHFSISYNKKLEQLSCMKCRMEEKEQLKEKLKQEEELHRETLRNEQEQLYAQAKQQMDRELLLNQLYLLRSSSLLCTPGCICWSCCRLRDLMTNLNSSTQTQQDWTNPKNFEKSTNETPLNTSSTFSQQHMRNGMGNDGEIALQRMEQEINSRATEMAKNYLAQLSESERNDEKLSFQKIFLVFKFSETPETVVLQGMRLMGASDSEQTRSYYKKLALMLHPDKNGHPLASEVFKKISNAWHSHQLAQKSSSAF